jgi:V-type H+-transporting ATPase subunit a
MKLFFDGRYMIILMGLFTVYTGLLYNECFSIPFNLFGSRWTINYTEFAVLNNEFLQLNPETQFAASYPFGFDPVWKVSFPLLDFEVLCLLIIPGVLFD